jgi:hypothetical protein
MQVLLGQIILSSILIMKQILDYQIKITLLIRSNEKKEVYSKNPSSPLNGAKIPLSLKKMVVKPCGLQPTNTLHH